VDNEEQSDTEATSRSLFMVERCGRLIRYCNSDVIEPSELPATLLLAQIAKSIKTVHDHAPDDCCDSCQFVVLVRMTGESRQRRRSSALHSFEKSLYGYCTTLTVCYSSATTGSAVASAGFRMPPRPTGTKSWNHAAHEPFPSSRRTASVST
jgi:hypothetical protein